MEKLELQRDEQDIFKIQVNEKGDIIEIDTTDIGLIERIMKASDEIALMDEKYEKEITNLLNNNEIDPTEKVKTMADKTLKYCNEMDKQFDSFLGEGACQKIFQGKKSPKQYLRLAEALEKVLKKIPMQMDKGKKKLAEKYLSGISDVL